MKIALFAFVAALSVSQSSFAVCRNAEDRAGEAVVMLEKLNGESNVRIRSSKQTSITRFRNIQVETGGMYASQYLVEISDSDDCRVMGIRFEGGQE